MDDRFLSRGKRKDNGEWIEGGVCQTENWVSISVVNDFGGSALKPSGFDIDEFEIIPETLGGCTGLTDKNGKPIFEGDIVKNERGEMLEITYSPPRYVMRNKQGFFFYIFDISNFEVIGNIHDNPELLESEVE